MRDLRAELGELGLQPRDVAAYGGELLLAHEPETARGSVHLGAHEAVSSSRFCLLVSSRSSARPCTCEAAPDGGVLAGDVGHPAEVEPLAEQGGRRLPRPGHRDLGQPGGQLDIAAQRVEHARHLTRVAAHREARRRCPRYREPLR